MRLKGFLKLYKLLLAAVSGGNLEACIVLGEDGDFVDVVPIKLKRYEGFKTQSYGSFNEALDEFYLRVITAERAFASVEVDKLKKEAERLRRVVAEQEKSINEDVAKSERDKLIGDTIYAHFNELQTFQEQLLKANQQGKDWNTVIAEALWLPRKQAKPLKPTLNRLTAKTLR